MQQLTFTDRQGVVKSARFISQPASLTLSVKRTSDNVGNPGVNSGNTTGFVRAGEPFTVTIGALMGGTPAVAPPSFGK